MLNDFSVGSFLVMFQHQNINTKHSNRTITTANK